MLYGITLVVFNRTCVSYYYILGFKLTLNIQIIADKVLLYTFYNLNINYYFK